MSPDSLRRSPEELVTLIGSFVSLENLLSFALTCKLTIRCVSKRLALQKESHEQYAIVHDRQPLIIPELLRRSISGRDEDNEVLWHIRTLQFWDYRDNFDNWKTTSFPNYVGGDEENDDDDDGFKLEPPQDYSHYSGEYFSREEMASYRRIFDHDLKQSWHETHQWIESIQDDGWEEPLKIMLISQLPHLKTLTMFANADAGDNDHPLYIFGNSVTKILTPASTPNKPIWPLGFASLTTLSIAEPLSGEYEDFRHPHDIYNCPYNAIAPLLQLPNIKNVEFSLAGYDDSPSSSELYNLPQGCSSVENLVFYCCDLQDEEMSRLIFSALELKSLILEATTMPEQVAEEAEKRYTHCVLRVT